MKLFAIIVLGIAALCYSTYAANVKTSPVQNSRAELVERIKSQANNVVDAVLDLLKRYAAEHYLEPMELPDMHEEFTISIFGIDFDGVLDLTNGLLSHLTTIARTGEATIEYNGNIVHITTEVEFSDLILDYNYDVSVMGVNPTGTLQGTAQGLRLFVDLSADLESFTTTLEGLNVVNAAKINIEVHGNGIADEIVNSIAGLVEPYFEQEILTFVEEKMRTTLAETLVDFDIHDIIG